MLLNYYTTRYYLLLCIVVGPISDIRSTTTSYVAYLPCCHCPKTEIHFMSFTSDIIFLLLSNEFRVQEFFFFLKRT